MYDNINGFLGILSFNDLQFVMTSNSSFVRGGFIF